MAITGPTTNTVFDSLMAQYDAVAPGNSGGFNQIYVAASDAYKNGEITWEQFQQIHAMYTRDTGQAPTTPPGGQPPFGGGTTGGSGATGALGLENPPEAQEYLAEQPYGTTLAQYLAALPGVNQTQRDILGARGRAAYESFGLGRTDPSETFGQYLRRAGTGYMTPQQVIQRLGQISSYQPTGQTSQDDLMALLQGQYAQGGDTNAAAMSAYLYPALRRLAPEVRGGAQNVMLQDYNRWQGQNPLQNFAGYLAGRGGYFGL